MKALGTIAKALLIFLLTKFITLYVVMALVGSFPSLFASLVGASGELSAEAIQLHSVNISTFLSSLLTLLILYKWPLVDKGVLERPFRNSSIGVTSLAVVMGVLGVMLTGFILTFFKDNYEDTVELSKKILSSGWIGIVPVVLIIPIVEEIVFRRICITALLPEMKAPWAIGLSALLFGILHIQLSAIVGATLLGLVFGAMYYLSKSLIPSIILHILNNGFYVSKLLTNQTENTNFMDNTSYLFWLSFIAVGGLFTLSLLTLYKRSQKIK